MSSRRMRKSAACAMVSRSLSGTKPTPAIAKFRRTTSDASARAMTSMALGRDEAAAEVLEEIAIAAPRRSGRRRESPWRARAVKSSVSVARPCIERGRDAAVVLRSHVERRELRQVLDEDGGGGAHVEAQIDEARLRRRLRAVVIDDREDLDALRVAEVGIEVVRVDEGRGSRPSRPPSTLLHLAELDVEQLHERAVLAVRQLVGVAE